jgi:hypothetical protein
MLLDRQIVSALIGAMLVIPSGCSSPNVSPSEFGAREQSSMHDAAACSPGFALALHPASATITSGQSVRVTMELTSLCGLSGTIDVGIESISPPPGAGNGFTIYQSRYDVPLAANGAAGAYIILGATPATLKTTYVLTIQAKEVSGCCRGLQHSATFALTVR